MKLKRPMIQFSSVAAAKLHAGSFHWNRQDVQLIRAIWSVDIVRQRFNITRNNMLRIRFSVIGVNFPFWHIIRMTSKDTIKKSIRIWKCHSILIQKSNIRRIERLQLMKYEIVNLTGQECY